MPSMADLRYSVRVVGGGGKAVQLDHLAEGLYWEEFEGELAQRAAFTVPNIKLENKRLAQLLTNGAIVKVFGGYTKLEECFTGRIFSNTSRWDPSPRHDVLAFDPMHYFAQSEDDRYYPEGKTGEAIIRDLCRSLAVPVGQITGPKTELSKKVWRGKLVGEMFERVFKETERKGGGKWLAQADRGRISVIRRGINAPFIFEGDFMSGLSVERSIEGLVTVVKIVGREKGKGRVLATATGATEYGHLQRIIDRAEYNNAAGAKRAATQVIKELGGELKRRTFVAPDIPSLRRGHRCIVRARTLNGPYIVTSVHHDPPSRSMTVEVEPPTEQEVEFEFEESGLWDWVPPDDRYDPGSDGKAATGEPGKKSSSGYQWPIKGAITSTFGDGRNHAGIDIDLETGDAVLASKPGTVTFAGTASGYGYLVKVAHGGGYETYYAHLSRFGCKVGDKVGYSRVIGYGGNTGHSTGSHLHFETRLNGAAFDPMSVLP